MSFPTLTHHELNKINQNIIHHLNLCKGHAVLKIDLLFANRELRTYLKINKMNIDNITRVLGQFCVDRGDLGVVLDSQQL